jgi:glycosyltransferase involved in cell wall biosynthesis
VTFGIATPCWRQESLLRLAAASVAEQCGDGVQVDHVAQIKDPAPEALAHLTQDCPALRVFAGDDSGMYDAINRALDHTQGEIMGYLNADEQYLPGALARTARFFQDHPDTDILFGDALLLDESWQPRVYRRVVTPQALYTRLWHLNTLTCATFWRRRVWEAGLRFDPSWKFIGDCDWVVRARAAGFRSACLPEPLAAFVYTGTNLGSSPAFEAERSTWRGGVPGGRWLRPPLQAAYILRKAIAGAYRTHSVTFGPYTPESFPHRSPARTHRLTWRWPRAWQHWRKKNRKREAGSEE